MINEEIKFENERTAKIARIYYEDLTNIKSLEEGIELLEDFTEVAFALAKSLEEFNRLMDDFLDCYRPIIFLMEKQKRKISIMSLEETNRLNPDWFTFEI